MIPADPARVEELRRELEIDLGTSPAVKSIARHYAEQEARADVAQLTLGKILVLLDGSNARCAECDVAQDLVADLRDVLAEAEVS